MASSGSTAAGHRDPLKAAQGKGKYVSVKDVHDSRSSPINASLDEMAPKPYDDLFIEPAGDYDVVYGDYNDTMEDPSGKRPYLRLTSMLPNVTRSLGGEVRIKCEAAGFPLPISFTWLKNNAPIEKNRRTKVRNKEYFSKLIISDLDVLDGGFYQCTATNVAGSVNSTAVLRVNAQARTPHKPVVPKPKPKPNHAVDDYSDDLYDDTYGSEEMDRGRLPSDEDRDLFRVPDTAGGHGYVPLGAVAGQDRWLDGVSLRVGDCIQYRGDACRNFLTGKHIMVTEESREVLYDVDRELRAAMMFIQQIPDLSAECKRHSHAVACYHMYKVCDDTVPSTSAASKVISLCRKDCDSLKDEVCPRGFSMAAQHELVGDGPKALLPHCSSLSPETGRCLRVLEPVQAPPPVAPGGKPDSAFHWCYVDSGRSYEGGFSEAVSGRRCLSWTQVRDSEVNVQTYPKLAKARNHCRNPDGAMPGPWCFTAPHGQRELCEVPRCPQNMYPGLADDAQDAPNGILNSVNTAWGNLSSQWQLAAMAGLGGFAVLMLVLLLLCCCRKKKGASSSSSSVKKETMLGVQSCNGSSIVTSGVTSGYPRKYPPGPNSYEMNALLPPTGPPSSGFLQGGYMQQQYSPPTTEPPVEPYQIQDIPSSQIKLSKLLGENQTVAVYEGQLFVEMGYMPVAVKSLKAGASRIERGPFEDEIKSIASFDHQNVIRMLGVSYLDGQNLSAVFDFSCHGTLNNFLRIRESHENDEAERRRNLEDFFRIGSQIAAGMDYLSRMSHVHRDLATRNCLVLDQQTVRIADFAAFQPEFENDYYMLPNRMRVPLRWLSREALDDNRYSSASDVYAFGVTLYEMYTYGRQPFDGFSHQDVAHMIRMRQLLPSPEGCPPNIYSIMIECWNEAPERRPTFGELHSRFQKWCLAGPSQFFTLTNRANSTHSGGSSGGKRQHSSSSGGHSLQRNGAFIPDPYQVPPPAPMHSTPKGPSYLSSVNSRSPKGKRDPDASPLMRGGNYTYSGSSDDD